MTLGDINSTVRVLLAEPSTTGRWSDADLATMINRSIKDLGLELNWPEGTTTLTTSIGVTEYTLPEISQILRVYVAGQPIVPTDIPTMGGDQIKLFDQTAASFGPQWNTQVNTVYPATSDTGYPYPSGIPVMAGGRPLYYLRGGNIGFVPPPAGAYTVSIDIVAHHPDLLVSGAKSLFPSECQSALAWKTCMYAHFADNRDDAALKLQVAKGEYEQAVKALRSWRDTLGQNAIRRPMPTTMRTYYMGPNTNG